MNKVRERNIGWRIDYFIVSNRIVEKVVDRDIHVHILGSDHCPILLTLDMKNVKIDNEQIVYTIHEYMFKLEFSR